MYFVDDIHLVLAHNGSVFGVIPQLADVFNRVVGCPVDLDDIYTAPFQHVCTRGACIARLVVNAVRAVKSASKDSRTRCFANTPGSGKQICMMHTLFCYGIFQRCCNMLLSDDVFEPKRTPFSGRDDVSLFFCHRGSRCEPAIC